MSRDGGVLAMDGEKEPLGAAAMLLMLIITAVSLCLLYLLSNELLTVLTAWILASLPIGVLVGHCVLSEDKIVCKINLSE